MNTLCASKIFDWMLYSVNNDLLFSWAKNDCCFILLVFHILHLLYLDRIWLSVGQKHGFLKFDWLPSGWKLIKFQRTKILSSKSSYLPEYERKIYSPAKYIRGAFLRKYLSVKYFRKNGTSQKFDSILNTPMEKFLSFCFGIIHLVRTQYFFWKN